MGYCSSVGMGGYAFAEADSQQMPPDPLATGTATLHGDGKLCIDGEVDMLPNTTATVDYSKLWGCRLGVNLDQGHGMTSPALPYALTGTGITVSTNGIPCCTRARVVLDEGGMEYCADLTDGQEIPWAMFNTTCWTTQGLPLMAAPTSPTVRVDFVTTKLEACPFTNFCITGIHL
jgi:hypothetical protein